MELAHEQRNRGRSMGRTIGRYSLLSRIAAGGMGEVYLARLQSMQGVEKPFAIKLLLPQFAERKEIVDMFITEARIASRMTHPNVCQVFELGLEGDELFICMEYLAGVPLTAILSRHTPSSPLPANLGISLIQQACAGLHYAHELTDNADKNLGVVHRDISPGNLFLANSGIVKVLDFGIAKANTNVHKTRTGLLKGKFGYMAPEHIKGMPLDRRADIFSLAIVLAELLTNRPLFNHRSEYEAIKEITELPLPSILAMKPDLPPFLEQVIHKALSRDLDERYTTMKEFSQDLTRAVNLVGGPADADTLADYLAQNFASELEEKRKLLKASVGSLGFSSSKVSGDAPTVLTPPPSSPDAPTVAAPDTLRESTAKLPRIAEPPSRARSSPILLALLGLSLGVLATVLLLPTKPESAPAVVFQGTLQPESDARRNPTLPTMTNEPTTTATGSPVLHGTIPPAPMEETDLVDEGAPSVARRSLVPRTKREPRAAAKDLSCGKLQKENERLSCYVKGHTGDLLKCIQKHLIATETKKLQLEFNVDRLGMPRQIVLTPNAIVTPPLGKCVETVVKRIEFGALDAPLNFKTTLNIRPSRSTP